MKKLLVLGASEFQIPLLKQAREMGIHTCVLDINPNAYGIRYADEYRQCSIKDYTHALKIAEDYKPNGITVGMCDVAVLTCAKLCKKLNLPGLDVDVAERSTDKFKMIDVFRRTGVPHPEYIYYKKGCFDAHTMTLSYPIISKPTDMAGSRGINLIKTENELMKLINDSIDSGDSGDVLVEEYLVGPEVSVELFIEGSTPYVLQITDKLTSGAPHFMELGHSQPSILDNNTKEQIKQVACDAVSALGLKDCVAHAEIIVTDDGPQMVEIGARMGGDGIQQQLIHLSTGINLQEIVVKQAMGEIVTRPESIMDCGSAIRFIPAKEGTIATIQRESINDPRVKMVHLFCKEGEYYEAAKDNSGRYGYVISQANNPEEACAACEDAIRKIKIEVK